MAGGDWNRVCFLTKRQYYYKCSHGTKQPWRSHYNAVCKDWVAKHNRTTRNWVGNCRSKTGSRRQSEKKTILKHFLKGFLKGKLLAPKWRKSADKSLSQPSCSHSNTIYEVQLQKTIVLRMQPKEEATLAIPFTLRERSYSCKAQWKSIGNSSTSNTCNPIYIAGRILQLQITMEFHRQPIQEHHLQSHLHCGNDPTVANHNGILSTTHARKTVDTPFTMRNRSEHDPSMIREWSEHIRPHTRPSRTRRTAEVDHRGSGTDFVWKNIGFRTSAISQKRISCETSSKTLSATPPPAPLAMLFALRKASYSCKSQWNSIDNSSSSTTCNPIYIAGTILQLQITMEFCRPRLHARKTVDTPFTMRNRSEHDPNMIRAWSEHIRPHTRPSRTRRTAEVDHRGSGTDFVWKNIGVSCICYLSKTHFVRDFLQNSIGNSSTSTTCNAIYIAGSILQLQITMEFHRQLIQQHHLQSHLHCGNDPTVANHNGILSTTHARKTVDTPFTMRNRSEHDPNMIRAWSEHIRPHTRPSRTRRTAEVDHRGSGTDFVWKNIGVSCICYLSKTHFVRDFLQNSIGNSSTSTTCNAIYIAESILQLQITMEFHRQLIQQHHLQSHLHCGNDPTVANHNGILSTTHARKTVDTPFTMRNRSEHDPNMIREWSEHIRPHTRPSRTRRTAEVDHRGSGTDFVWKNIGVSYICYLSKTHFVRDFLQNSIGNSSTSTTCNAIYIAGSILQLQITMEFHRQLIQQHHLQSHLHCGNDPTVANHNGILSTTHARKTVDTPFTMRNRSEHDPNMIRAWSDHTRDRLAPVAPQR